MADPTTAAPRDDGGADHDTEAHPRGTLVLMLLYLVLTVAMWGYLYAMLMGRG